jgi:hypothetical protein
MMERNILSAFYNDIDQVHLAMMVIEKTHPSMGKQHAHAVVCIKYAAFKPFDKEKDLILESLIDSSHYY